MENVKILRDDLMNNDERRDRVRFMNVDTGLVYQLTGSNTITPYPSFNDTSDKQMTMNQQRQCQYQ